jgi:glycosyltransferase involved in cell wall biosynthesis
MADKIKLAIVSTTGIPAKYGGWETLAEFLAEYLADKIEITVFCGKEQSPRLKEYKKARLEYLPFSAHGWQCIIYDSASIFRGYRRFDKILILGCSNVAMLFMGKYKEKFILNIGGIEWQRAKWGRLASRMIKFSEKISVRNSNYLVADNEGIKDYLAKTYGRASVLIEYGGDQAKPVKKTDAHIGKYPFLREEYCVSVLRAQPDNNIEMIVRACMDVKEIKFVIISNWDINKYGKRIRNLYKNVGNVHLLDAIYDQEELNLVRGNAKLYIHGHSAGGTNPGLVECMHLGLPVFCFDNVFNRFTTENKAVYFGNSETLRDLLTNLSDRELDRIAKDMKEIAGRRYTWERVARRYCDIITGGVKNNG